MREDYLRGDSDDMNPVEREIEKVLRPLTFEDFTGQQKIIDNIKVFVLAARQREEQLDHVLLHGPPGLGKTTLSHIIANELESHIKITSGPVLDKPSDLAGLLTNLEAHDVLFIDEIHRLGRSLGMHAILHHHHRDGGNAQQALRVEQRRKRGHGEFRVFPVHDGSP